jgi:hypothetical protein
VGPFPLLGGRQPWGRTYMLLEIVNEPHIEMR